MIDLQLLEILRCPQDHSRLAPAQSAVVAAINRAIHAGKATNLSGNVVSTPLDGGLIRAAGDLLYPVVDGIPVMLHDEAIALDQFEDVSALNSNHKELS